MVKRTVEELSTYNAPGHHGCTCMRYHGKDETGAEVYQMFHLICKDGKAQTLEEIFGIN